MNDLGDPVYDNQYKVAMDENKVTKRSIEKSQSFLMLAI